MQQFIVYLSPNFEWSHEDASIILLRKLVDDNKIDISDDSVRRI